MGKFLKFLIFSGFFVLIFWSFTYGGFNLNTFWADAESVISENLIVDGLHGKASYYGDEFHGRITSNGEIFDQNKLTAAHKALPFGTKVKVNNLDNGKSVVVKINDRGPFKSGRIIDLSHSAAKELGMLTSGLAEVELEVVD